MKLAIATDGSATLIPADATAGLKVSEARGATATLANVAASATSVTLRASNTGRLGLYVFNDSDSILYIKLGATASSTSFTVKCSPGAFWELPYPGYTGVVDGIWVTASGNARVTEITA